MQQLAELIPLLFFFAVFFLKGHTLEIGPLLLRSDGLMSATLALVIATVVVAAALYIKHGRLEKRLAFLSLLVVVMGLLTLVLQSSHFIFWKPTVFNWGMALAFIGARLIGRRSLLALTLGAQIRVPEPVWQRLDWLWIGNFTLVGSLNLWVAYSFSEAAWVSYKLYSAIGFTLLLSILTATLLAPHLPGNENTPPAP